jgi:hypothetical protein
MSANIQADVAMHTVDANGELQIEFVSTAAREILVEARGLSDDDLRDLGRVIMAMKLGLFTYTAEQIEAWSREERCRVIAALPLPDMCEAA